MKSPKYVYAVKPQVILHVDLLLFCLPEIFREYYKDEKVLTLFAYSVVLHALLSSADCFQNQLFQNFFQEYHQNVKEIGSRSK